MGVTARLFSIRGRVQGVGYRNFASRVASDLGITGYARNLADGSVEVFAMGTEPVLDEFAGRLRCGPRWAHVRAVDVAETSPRAVTGFAIR